jgi:[ribosomal protein S5]-alanine N-acetyltransferase
VSPGGLGLDRVTTARLVGRRPEPGDLDAVMGFFCDPRVDEEAWPSAFRTPERAKEVLDHQLAHWERWGFGPWMVELGGRVIGWTGLQHTTIAGRPEVELLWFVHPDHWGQGYTTEMAREAVRAAFEVLELDDVVAFTVPVNAASRAVMEKLGMTYEREIEHVGLPHVLYRLRR